MQRSLNEERTDARDEASALKLSQVISAMTFALDLTEGAAPGHALRSCLLGMRIGAALGLAPQARADLYYALLLKDAGCSSNASRMHQIVGGDDRKVKAAAKLADWTRPLKTDLRTLRSLWHNVTPERGALGKTAHMIWMAATQHTHNREMIALRCERGAKILRQLQMSDVSADAVKRLDEHWDGSGYPDGLCGTEIPLLARICSLAQNLDVFCTADGRDAAMEVARARRGTWFDPLLVDIVEQLDQAGDFWEDCGEASDAERTQMAVLELDPGMSAPLTEERVDSICEAFGSIVDAKSPFTFEHSVRVANVAEEIAVEMGLTPDRVRMVRRAGLLHDIGKLAVANLILDKRGPLSDAERAVMREHPALTESVLERVSMFAEIAAIAGQHHEKLDGSGYPRGVRGDAMSLEARILAVADNFTALAEDRAYRVGLDLQQIWTILAQDVPHRLDEECFGALMCATDRWQGNWPAPRPVEKSAEEISVCWMAPQHEMWAEG